MDQKIFDWTEEWIKLQEEWIRIEKELSNKKILKERSEKIKKLLEWID
jgi:hypothetical protein